MNGAESLVRTLVANGVDVCFANPGTSEMHFVAALHRNLDAPLTSDIEGAARPFSHWVRTSPNADSIAVAAAAAVGSLRNRPGSAP